MSSDQIFEAIAAQILVLTPEKKESLLKANSVFRFDVATDGKVASWILTLKGAPALAKAADGSKADVTIAVSDKDFVSLATGKLNGQKAFMAGKIKVKGQMMLATSNMLLIQS